MDRELPEVGDAVDAVDAVDDVHARKADRRIPRHEHDSGLLQMVLLVVLAERSHAHLGEQLVRGGFDLPESFVLLRLGDSNTSTNGARAHRLSLARTASGAAPVRRRSHRPCLDICNSPNRTTPTRDAEAPREPRPVSPSRPDRR